MGKSVLFALVGAFASVATAGTVVTKFGTAEFEKHVPESKTQVAAILYALTENYADAARCPVAKLNARGYAVVTLDCTKLTENKAEGWASAIKAVKAEMANDRDIAADYIGVILDKVQPGWDEVEANWTALADSYDRKGWNADPSKVAKTRPFTVMAWNLEGKAERSAEKASLVALLKDLNPDVLLISEQYGILPDLLAGMGGGWSAERYSMNLALLAHWPIVRTERPWEGKWNYLDPTGPYNFGFAELEVDGQRVRACPLWLNWEHGKPRFSNPREVEMKGILGSIRAEIADADNVPLVIGGDFNGYIEPHEPLMEKAGFTDTYRMFHPELDGTNTWTWASSKDPSRREFVDYIFSKGAKLKPVASETFRATWHKPFEFRGKSYASYPSDHGFVLTTFELDVPRPVSKVFLTKGGCAIEKAIPYRDIEGCVLDLCHPTDVKDYPTIVWFHGGGLTSGRRGWIPVDTNRIAVATVEYRLMPKVGPDGCLDDGAAAVAWVKRHIAEYGGDPGKVFVSGHSAGGYMTFMLGLDGRWLGKYGVTPFDCAGYMPLSGQVTKHFAVRKHFGHAENKFQPIVDEWAPMFHLKKETPPFCVALGDPRIEWRMREEENLFMVESLKAMGNKAFEFHSFPNTNHGTCHGPAMPVFQAFVDRICAGRK